MAKGNEKKPSPPKGDEKKPEETLLVVTRKVALGNGTRQPGFVLGKIKNPENLSVEGITLANGVEKVEIINALANPDIYKAQA